MLNVDDFQSRHINNYSNCQNADDYCRFMTHICAIPGSIRMKQKLAHSSQSPLSAHKN